MKLFIGWDKREHDAYLVAASSAMKHSSVPLEITPLRSEVLAAQGLLCRPTDTRGGIYDLPSNAPCSTEFAISRFLVPMLAQSGWALFTDCDVVFLEDVAELFALRDPRYAVMVVKHFHLPHSATKMDGQSQTAYPRKNWSSVILWNCDHPANRRLSLSDVNHRRGFDLHQFYWLHDSEIGDLPAEWNWLVNAQPKPERPKLAHFTLGGPFLADWQPSEYDGLWIDARKQCEST